MGDWGMDVPGLDKFNTVQDVLETNQHLINQINRNHDLRTPEALARNVVLIRQLNANVGKVVELYKELSVSFATAFSENGSGQPR